MNFKKNKQKTLYAIALALFTDMFFYCLVTPMLPIYATHYQISHLGFSLIFGGYAIALLLGTTPVGYLIDRFGRRLPMLWGLISLFVAIMTFTIANSVIFFVIARFMQGLSSAFTWNTSMALLSDSFNKKTRGKIMGYAIACANLGALISLPLSGWLHQNFGIKTPFLLITILALVDAAIRLSVIKNTDNIVIKKIKLKTILTNYDIKRYIGSIIIVAMLLGTLDANMPSYLYVKLKMTPIDIGLYFSIAAIINMTAAPIVGFISDRYGRKNTIVVGLLIAALCVYLSTMMKSTLEIILTMMCIGISKTLILSSANPGLADTIDCLDSNGYGYTFSISNTIYALGALTGPILSSLMIHIFGLNITIFSAAAICTIYSSLFIRWKRHNTLFF